MSRLGGAGFGAMPGMYGLGQSGFDAGADRLLQAQRDLSNIILTVSEKRKDREAQRKQQKRAQSAAKKQMWTNVGIATGGAILGGATLGLALAPSLAGSAAGTAAATGASTAAAEAGAVTALEAGTAAAGGEIAAAGVPTLAAVGPSAGLAGSTIGAVPSSLAAGGFGGTAAGAFGGTAAGTGALAGGGAGLAGSGVANSLRRPDAATPTVDSVSRDAIAPGVNAQQGNQIAATGATELSRRASSPPSGVSAVQPGTDLGGTTPFWSDERMGGGVPKIPGVNTKYAFGDTMGGSMLRGAGLGLASVFAPTLSQHVLQAPLQAAQIGLGYARLGQDIASDNAMMNYRNRSLEEESGYHKGILDMDKRQFGETKRYHTGMLENQKAAIAARGRGSANDTRTPAQADLDQLYDDAEANNATPDKLGEIPDQMFFEGRLTEGEYIKNMYDLEQRFPGQVKPRWMTDKGTVEYEDDAASRTGKRLKRQTYDDPFVGQGGMAPRAFGQ